LSDLVAAVSKKPVPAHQKNVIFEIVAEDQSGEDVEIPYVMMRMDI
jgi:ubiquitin-activating enzyme E1